MPPSGKLKDAEIAALAAVDRMGAPWGASKTRERILRGKTSGVRDARSKVPQVSNAVWAKSPLDAFVLAALESKPRPAHGRGQTYLIRRLRSTHWSASHAGRGAGFLEECAPDAFARSSTGCWPLHVTANVGAPLAGRGALRRFQWP